MMNVMSVMDLVSYGIKIIVIVKVINTIVNMFVVVVMVLMNVVSVTVSVLLNHTVIVTVMLKVAMVSVTPVKLLMFAVYAVEKVYQKVTVTVTETKWIV